MENSPKIIYTSDGSPTLFLENLDETYHSRHGAMQESQHVFIKMGLEKVAETKSHFNLLEVGLGTGLNAWITWDAAKKLNLGIHYTGVEAFPLSEEVIEKIIEGFSKTNHSPPTDLLRRIHDAPWNDSFPLDANLELLKISRKIQEVDFSPGSLDLVYYDAFGPRAQSEMWEQSIFEHIVPFINPGGILVSYCAQGQFRRNLIAMGMEVEKVEGPPGKREMTRAVKL